MTLCVILSKAKDPLQDNTCKSDSSAALGMEKYD
jgi:hypothetical protein